MKVRDSNGAGFHGKVRTHGDFVGKGLSAAFVGAWHAWLQRGLALAHARLGDTWLERYLSMPVWRFAMGAGVVDDGAHAGVLMPGIDAVGRYFPLVIARAVASVPHASWFDGAEALALSTLDPAFSLREFEASLAALPLTSADGAACRAGSEFWTAEHHAICRHDGALDAALFVRLLDRDTACVRAGSG